MIGFDVNALAQSLMMDQKEPLLAKEAIIQEMISMAVEIVNNPFREDYLMDKVEFTLEIEYGIPNAHKLIKSFVKHINEEKNKRGWDPRLLVKVEFRSILRAYHKAVVTMDLENTFLLRGDHLLEDMKEKPEISELVDDNPNLDAINELIGKIDSESGRKSPLLSNRHKRNVVPIKRRG